MVHSFIDTKLSRLLLLALLFLLLFAATFQAQGFGVTGNSPPRKIDADALFTSLDGRFTIALPKTVSAYRPVSIDTPAGRATGQSFSWSTVQGSFAISYIDRLEQLEGNSKLVFDNLRDGITAKAFDNKARLNGEKDFTLGTHPGRELKFELPDGVLVIRLIFDEQRLYQITFSLLKAQAAQEASGFAVLDSFSCWMPLGSKPHDKRLSPMRHRPHCRNRLLPKN